MRSAKKLQKKYTNLFLETRSKKSGLGTAYIFGFKWALENKYDLHLLTYIDTPWEQDDLRDRPDRREEMFNYFKHTLEKYKKPFILVKGTVPERMVTATESINTLLV